MPEITKGSTMTGFSVWLNRCISAAYEIVNVENAELGLVACIASHLVHAGWMTMCRFVFGQNMLDG